MNVSSNPERGFSASLRRDAPDFLDLPWEAPLADWEGRTGRLELLPRGPSRHTVVFVGYGGVVYALKELPVETAVREYETLKAMHDQGLPVVQPVGHVRTVTAAGEAGVLVTRYLDRSLPYSMLFRQRSLERYRNGLLDALSSLLVQLHLAGVFWGDCSLYNTLFRRDAGTLQAYLVDAETSALHAPLSPELRQHDLEIMEENIFGALLDLQAAGDLDAAFPPEDMVPYLRRQYDALWDEVTREEVFPPGERWRIQERIRNLNSLGFSVDEIELSATSTGDRLRLRTLVTDRNFHRNFLHSLTGIDAEEHQARQMVNEIQEMKAGLSRAIDRSVPVSVAAFRWLNECYLPARERLAPLCGPDQDPGELYCEVLEHKWYLSEKAQCDVGREAALDDYLAVRRG